MAYQGMYTPKNPSKYVGDPQNIVYRSLWEKRFFDYCDTKSEVLEWASEEFFVPYLSPVDKQMHRYFPDVYLKVKTETGHKVLIVEIKPKYQTQQPQQRKRRTKKFLTEVATYAVNQAKWAAARAYCAQRQWQFLVLTEEHLFGTFK